MRTAFLLGSGISIDAKMPSVDDVTTQVMSGEGVWRHTDGSFVLGSSSSAVYELYRPPVGPILRFTADLAARATEFFRREPNYEQIAQLAQAIADPVPPAVGEYENPAVMPLLRELAAQVDAEDGDALAMVQMRAAETHSYIGDTVCGLLRVPPVRVDHLEILLDACEHLGGVTFATLNHDLVFEDALRTAGVHFADGFEPATTDVRKWIGTWGESPVRLLKLHGSIDWWRYAFAGDDWRGAVAAQYSGADAIHPARADVLGPPQDVRPLVLVGTFDKILSYETSLFLDQHFRFREELRKATRVVVIGYGFADKAINSRLIDWLARDRANRMIVCHPDSDRLLARARGAIQHSWARWQRNGQLAVVPAYVGDLQFSDVSAELR
ncbi:MAG TPA: SIR2 family protein [Solirubrobacteraceae bacterium]|nr:SIR2 family protein [Solirubrobacteraceae bacterium]